ncbi:Protein PHLOEM PROTEIN 2-LIKE A8 [Cardamine amara subsp. amara]|uniref:Protein PHLOEM PROTEIN 2-LIKE A8 n=1 Tax=Cardamine amara subsp. amara TaxID=228776 RepID=A0ABD1BZL1_CARAN
MENTNYKKDQVFISFRGKDERHRFLTLLRQKLIDAKVNVFTDDKLVGQRITNLFGHIRNSRIAIVIFSQSYAESVWCLNELVEIKKCIETENLKAVIPIFHMVEVSSVKEQSGEFGEKFLALQKSLLAKEVSETDIELTNSKIKKWKKALKIVTQMSGLTYEENSSEWDFADKVVADVKRNLANIAAEKGRNIITRETRKTSQGKQPNMIIYNINQFNLNNHHDFSKSLEALNPEGYNRVSFLPIYPDLRRTHSDLDHPDQYAPFPFEAVMVQKQFKNQRVIDNIVRKQYRSGTTCFSSLRYLFELCLCLTCIWPRDQKMIQMNNRNEPSLASN